MWSRPNGTDPDSERNHNDVFYPLPWISLWTTVVKVIPALAVLVLLMWMGATYGWLRAAIAAILFVAIFVFGSRYFFAILQAPPEPELADVSPYDLKYVCSMCGLQLKVEVAAKDRPPTHCGEPMQLVSS